MDVNVRYASAFRKHYPKRIKPFPALHAKFEERLSMLLTNSRNPLLHDHELKGNKVGCRSCSITGDIRLLYRVINDVIELLDIGTHNQVYK